MIEEIGALLEKDEGLKVAKRNYEEARIIAQMVCGHGDVVETEYRKEIVGRPFRVCRDCGYAEEGWGSGYSFLDGNAEMVDRSVALGFVRGRVIDNGEHGKVRLGRKRLTEILA